MRREAHDAREATGRFIHDQLRLARLKTIAIPEWEEDEPVQSSDPITAGSPNLNMWLRTPDPKTGPYEVQLRWDTRDGAAVLEGAVIFRTDGQPFKGSDVRAFRWLDLVNEDRRMVATQAESWTTAKGFFEDAGVDTSEFVPETVTDAVVQADARRTWNDQHYREVAAWHREAKRLGRRDSLNYIREQYNDKYPDRKRATKTTVRNWVRAARKKGLL